MGCVMLLLFLLFVGLLNVALHSAWAAAGIVLGLSLALGRHHAQREHRRRAEAEADTAELRAAKPRLSRRGVARPL